MLNVNKMTNSDSPVQWAVDYPVIDMHTHMGPEYCLYYPEHDATGMIRFMDECSVGMIVSSSCEDLFGGSVERTEIQNAMNDYPGRIMGYFAFNPLLEITKEEMERAFRKHPGYVGVKLLPDYHRTSLADARYDPALRFADDNGLIVLSHTWGLSMNGETCNSADKVEAILRKYRFLKLIMGHSIQGQTDKAIRLAGQYDNAYLDLCDTGRLNGMIEKMVASVGAEKVLFGTDAPMQSFRFMMGAVFCARISDNQRRMIMRDNALRLLRLSDR